MKKTPLFQVLLTAGIKHVLRAKSLKSLYPNKIKTYLKEASKNTSNPISILGKLSSFLMFNI